MNSKVSKHIEDYFAGTETRKQKKMKWKSLNWIEKSKISKTFRNGKTNEI